MQQMLVDEVTDFLGRRKHQRRGVDMQGYRNGYGKPRRLTAFRRRGRRCPDVAKLLAQSLDISALLVDDVCTMNDCKEIYAPGKAFREGISLIKLFEMFPDNAAAERWFAEQRWPVDKPSCPCCGCTDVQVGARHESQPYRCRNYRECGKRFSVKIGTVMEGSNIKLQKWAIGIYLVVTSLKGVSSMKLHRDLKIGQKAAWHLGHRIRMAWNGDIGDLFEGPAEVDEAYFGGKEANKHADKKLNEGRGTVGKVAVAGVKGPETNRISAAVVDSTTKRDLHSFEADRLELGADIYTDELGSYRGLPNHAAVKHSSTSRRRPTSTVWRASGP